MSAGDELSAWLDAGYRNLRAQLGAWIAVAAIVIGASVLVAVIQELVGMAAESAGDRSRTGAALLYVGSGMLGVGFVVLQTWMQLGAWRMALEQAAGRPVSVGRLLAIEPRQLGSALVFMLLLYLAIGLAVAAVVAVSVLSMEAAIGLGLTAAVSLLVIYGRLQFVYGLIVLDLGALEAIERSFLLTRGRTGTVVAFALLVGLFSALGVLACCVGLVVTAPYQWTAGAAALRDLARRAEPGEEAPGPADPGPPPPLP